MNNPTPEINVHDFKDAGDVLRCLFPARGTYLVTVIEPYQERDGKPYGIMGSMPAPIPGTVPLAIVVCNHIMATLRGTKGNQLAAARILGISRWTLKRKMQKYGIGKDGYPLIHG